MKSGVSFAFLSPIPWMALPYLDDFGQSLPYAQFYAQMRQGSMPTTSTINTLMYDETFSPHLKAGKDILYLCFSSALSSSYENAQFTRDRLMARYPGPPDRSGGFPVRRSGRRHDPSGRL